MVLMNRCCFLAHFHLIIGRKWLRWPNDRSGCSDQNEKCLCLSECLKLTGTWCVPFVLWQDLVDFLTICIFIRVTSSLNLSVQVGLRSCCECASTCPTFCATSTVFRMLYQQTLSLSCLQLWLMPLPSVMGIFFKYTLQYMLLYYCLCQWILQSYQTGYTESRLNAKYDLQW